MKEQNPKKVKETAYPSDQSLPPSQEELEAKALYYIRTNKPKSYREMKKSGTLQNYCTLSANAARDYAENLIASGETIEQAWNRAIRLEILESETD